MSTMTRVTRYCVVATAMAFAVMACEADSASEPSPANTEEPEENATGSVDVASSTPNVETPPEVTVDAGPSPSDTVSLTPDSIEEPEEEEPEEEDPRFGNEIIVGQGACTNDSDIEALNGFDPVDDFMTVGMACINTRSSPGETDDELLISCLVGELASGYGFSEECGTCVALHVVCSQEHCMDKCMSFMMTGEISDECTECINESDCKSDFTGCSGLDPDEIQP